MEDFVEENMKYFQPFQKELISFKAFVQGVDWTEPWIICLMIFHLAVTIITLTTRHHGNFQAVFFMILLLLVFISANLNEMAARNWKYFSRQQYFDSNGMFISVVFSSPILLNCLVMVGHWLWTSGMLMVKVKQAQLRRELRAERSRQHKLRKESSSRGRPDSSSEREGPSSKRESRESPHARHRSSSHAKKE